MVEFEDDCVGCDYGSCVGCCYSGKSAHLYCDDCKEEIEILYEYDGKELCEDCLREAVEPECDEDGEEIEVDLDEYETITYESAENERYYEPEYDPCEKWEREEYERERWSYD